jgi:hypothetical protein
MTRHCVEEGIHTTGSPGKTSVQFRERLPGLPPVCSTPQLFACRSRPRQLYPVSVVNTTALCLSLTPASTVCWLLVDHARVHCTPCL